MDNKRLAELNELLASQVVASDLFLIGDQSVPESKRITATNLQTYILNGSASYAMSTLSSSYAGQAGSASYAPCISASYAKTASWASWVVSASYSSSSLSASYALSASWASRCISASYASTSSVQLVISSANATYAQSASYLMYTPGVNNGRIGLADTASYVANAINSTTSVSASWASNSVSTSYIAGNNVVGPVVLSNFSTYATNAGTAANGIFTTAVALASGSQTRTGATLSSPDTASGLVVTVTSVVSTSPTYLINLSAAVGGVTGISLYRSSSQDPVGGTPLISTIGVSSASLSAINTISATYVDSPVNHQPGDTLWYLAMVYNNNGAYYLNQSFDGTQFATSSMTLIEI